MLTVYFTALVVGGSLLLLSLMGIGESDSDVDVDIDGGFDHGDADAHGDLDFGGFDAWLPIGSLRFWTFFSAFFGLVGSLLVLATGMNPILALGPSLGVGYVSGVSAVKILRNLTKKEVGKVVGAKELVGTTGTLLLPVAPGTPGKVRMQLGGRSFEEIARSEDANFAVGDKVLVIAIHEEEGVVITPAPLLGERTPNGKDNA